MIVVTNKEVYSDSNKYIHRIGTDTYFKRCIKLPNDSIEMFEEVDNLPDDELSQARKNKIDEITAYDESKAVNQFYLSGIGMWYKADKRATIRNLVESNIRTGNDRVTLWTEEEPIVGLEFNCEEALMMLAQLEVYAGNCLAVTQQHKANVMALQTKEEIEAYDYTTGYPDKLNFNYTAS